MFGFLLSIFFVALIGSIFIFYTYNNTHTQNSELILLEKQIKNFYQELYWLSNSIDALHELSNRYFITLNENGFQELCFIQNTIQISLNYCDILRKGEDLETLKAVIHYLYVSRGRGKIPSALLNEIEEQSYYITNWGTRANHLLDQITASIDSMSTHFQELCGSRMRQRKNTSFLIEEARIALNTL